MLPSGAIGHIAVTGNTAVWLDVLKKTVMTRAGKEEIQHGCSSQTLALLVK